MNTKNTFKVVIRSEPVQEKVDEKGGFFKMQKTYHVPMTKLSEVITYLEQFKEDNK